MTLVWSLVSLICLVIGFCYGSSRFDLFSIDHVSKIISSVASLAGLVLGYFFYKAKIDNDEEVSKKNRKRQRFVVILDFLKVVEKTYLDVVNLNVANQADLDAKKDLIENNLSNVTAFIDSNDKLLGLTQDEIVDLVSLSSYYEGTSVVYYLDLKNLTALFAQSPEIKTQQKIAFNKYMYSAKKICILKSE